MKFENTEFKKIKLKNNNEQFRNQFIFFFSFFPQEFCVIKETEGSLSLLLSWTPENLHIKKLTQDIAILQPLTV